MSKFSKDKNKVVIDADGCPVVRITARVAREYNVVCVIVCDNAHLFDIDGTETVVVSQGADSADFYIVNHITSDDVVVTQDYGLAAMCMARNSTVINQDGREYNELNIDTLLETRAEGKKIRRAGGRTKGPHKRSKLQDENFELTLRKILSSAEN